jgi:hypothetical protein
MLDATFSVPGGPALQVSAKALQALQSWPDLDLGRLVEVAGELHACRKTTGQPHRQSLRELVALVDVPEVVKTAEVVQVATVAEDPQEGPEPPRSAAGAVAPSFGVVPPPGLPDADIRPRLPLHCHRDRVVYVPLMDLAEYAVISMRDYYRLRDAGVNMRMLRVQRESRPGQRRRPVRVLASRFGSAVNDVRVADLLCEGQGDVAAVDGNGARLLPCNLSRMTC